MRTVTLLPVKESTVAAGNFDTTRKPITTIVLHTMVGTMVGTDTRFNYPPSKVSAHYGVGVDGSLVHWVDEDKTAYHAGNYDVNQASIGIEHEDLGNYQDTRPDALYETSARLVADICTYYAIPLDSIHVVRHQNVEGASTACPDALDTNRIIETAKKYIIPKVSVDGPVFEELVRKSTEYDKFKEAGYENVDKLSTFITQAAEKDKTIITLQNQAAILKSEYDKLDTSLTDEKKLHEAEVAALTTHIQSFETLKSQYVGQLNEIKQRYDDCTMQNSLLLAELHQGPELVVHPPSPTVRQRIILWFKELTSLRW